MLGAEQEIIPINIWNGHEALRANPWDRCYHCKSMVFGTILEHMRADGRTVLLDGTNASDREDRRPGFRAIHELGIVSPLRAAGLTRLNVSLDTLRPDRYRAITRTGELADALAGLAAAREAGFESTKINCVLMGGVNDADVPRLAELARTEPIDVRFIELMPMGPCAGWPKARFIPAETVLEAVPGLEPLRRDGVAELWHAPSATAAAASASRRTAGSSRACTLRRRSRCAAFTGRRFSPSSGAA